MTELLVFVAIIVALASLLFPLVRTLRESADHSNTISRMRQCGIAIHTYTSERNGEVYSLYQPTRRWPQLVADQMGMDLSSGTTTQQYERVYREKVWRSADLDPLVVKMQEGSMPVSNLGVFLMNQFFTNYPAGNTAYRWRLNMVSEPSKTPLLAPAAENSGWFLNVAANAPGTKATAAGYAGATNAQGPSPDRKGRITYLMCDGSIQVRENFWPFKDSQWPTPWKAFHPRGKDAPDDLGASGP